MPKAERIKYEVDPFNRLAFAKKGKTAGLPRFRNVLDGTFRIGRNNLLVYQLRSSSHPALPRRLKLSGNWSLNPQHQLALTLDKEQAQEVPNRLTLKGELIDAREDALVFSFSSKDADGKTHLYLLELEGKWQADRYNRLSFLAKKEKGLYDTLVLSGSWEVNEQNQIIYTYTKTGLKTKKKVKQEIAFKGFWEINQKQRILYALNKELGSGFEFKVNLAKPAKRGLEYELGLGLAPKKKKITLFGSWKVSEKLGLLFQMPYQDGKIRGIIFEADCKLADGYNLNLRLKNTRHEDLGIKLKLSKSLFKDEGEAFLEALKDGKEVSLLAGAGFRW